MKSKQLIALFDRMLAEHWPYEWGAAREGCVDCSGAFVWAFKQFGQSIHHGSNTIARKYISGKLQKASTAKPGWAVFKQKFDGEEPTQYQSDGLGNFYHIGLLGSDGVNVLNAKGVSSGFSSDPLSKWQYAAPLKGVEYEIAEVIPVELEFKYKARIKLSSGYLNVRSAPSTSASSIGKLYNGDVVDCAGAYPANSGWLAVRTSKIDCGYIASEYAAVYSADNPPLGYNMYPYLKLVDSAGQEFNFFPGRTFTLTYEEPMD